MRTLCIDIGGTGIKAILLDDKGSPITDRVRVETPRPAVPDAVIAKIDEIARSLGDFDRVSVGFPGVVIEGTTKTAPNLDPSWANYPLAQDLERRLRKPVRVCNDAGVQGLGAIKGKGVEVVITLGTGMGFGLYIDGKYVPNIELGHHPFKKGQTYEDRVDNTVRKKIGNRRWRKRVLEIIGVLQAVFNYDKLYIGGGNARHLHQEDLPENVEIVDNVAGLLGGLKLWT